MLQPIVVAEPSSNRPWVGHKGALWLKALTTGVTAHGSMPEQGVNAVYKAARGISKLEDFDFNIARHPHLGGNSLSVGNLHAGQNVNLVPDQAALEVDIRTIPGVDHARVLDDLRHLRVVALARGVVVGRAQEPVERGAVQLVAQVLGQDGAQALAEGGLLLLGGLLEQAYRAVSKGDKSLNGIESTDEVEYLRKWLTHDSKRGLSGFLSEK